VAAAACARDVAPQRHDIAIRDFTYQPAELTIAAGDTVVWTNYDIVPHTATASDGAWDSAGIDVDQSWTYVAAAPGRHSYTCTFHPAMTAVLVVE